MITLPFRPAPAPIVVIVTEDETALRTLAPRFQMPGSLDGLELARYVRRHWPRVAVLIASGNKGPCSTEVPDGSRFLHKPYRTGRLLADVREVVAAS